ncbi:prefoldin subunit [Babesia ovata]|uniref:Prefoldin subunit n=1 Tax=Babesia ovata TaxID=189622 RepID=A0A2H6K9X3_9APIC|nr:prefoldin subunit [Babesia ovata]GBE59749.1 prefoldin subunit [Babesia ovata]
MHIFAKSTLIAVVITLVGKVCLAVKEQSTAKSRNAFLDFFKLTGDVVPSTYPVLKFNQSANNDSTFAALRRRELQELQEEAMRLLPLQRRNFEGITHKLVRQSNAVDELATAMERQRLSPQPSSPRTHIVAEYRELAAAHSQLLTQQNECTAVLKELQILEADAKIYKSTGPVLTAQSKDDALNTITKRIEYISNEIDEKAKAMANLQGAIEEKCRTVSFKITVLKSAVGRHERATSTGCTTQLKRKYYKNSVLVLEHTHTQNISGGQDNVLNFLLEFDVRLAGKVVHQGGDELRSVVKVGGDVEGPLVGEDDVDDGVVARLLDPVLGSGVVLREGGNVSTFGAARKLNGKELSNLDLAGTLHLEHDDQLVVLFEGERQNLLFVEGVFLTVIGSVLDSEAVVFLLDTFDGGQQTLLLDDGEGVESELVLVEHLPVEEGTNFSGTVELAVNGLLLPEDGSGLEGGVGDHTTPERADDTDVTVARAGHDDSLSMLARDGLDVRVFSVQGALDDTELGLKHEGLLVVSGDTTEVEIKETVGSPLGAEGTAAATLTEELQKIQTVPPGVVLFEFLTDNIPDSGLDGQHEDDLVGTVLPNDIDVRIVVGGTAEVLRVDDLVVAHGVTDVERLVNGAATLVLAEVEGVLHERPVAVVVPVLPGVEETSSTHEGQVDHLALFTTHNQVKVGVDGGNHLTTSGLAGRRFADTANLQGVAGVGERHAEEVVDLVNNILEVGDGLQDAIVKATANLLDVGSPVQTNGPVLVNVQFAGKGGYPQGVRDSEPSSRGA